MMPDISGSSTIYIDTNIFVYFIEASPEFFPETKKVFERIDAAGARIATNEITVSECIYKPSQNGDAALVGVDQTLFEKSGDVALLPLDGALAKRAAMRGGELGLKLIDAIHYISAIEARCDWFLTSDSQFKPDANMKVWTIGPEG